VCGGQINSLCYIILFTERTAALFVLVFACYVLPNRSGCYDVSPALCCSYFLIIGDAVGELVVVMSFVVVN